MVDVLTSSGADRGRLIADILSYSINPLVLTPVGAGLILGHFAVPGPEWWQLVLLSTLFFCVLPLSYVLILVRQGKTGSLEVRVREDRNGPLLVSLALGIIAAGTMIPMAVTVQPIVSAMIITQICATIIVWIVNRFWKISLHLTGLAGFVAALVYVALNSWTVEVTGLVRIEWVIFLFPVVPLLMWARIKAESHTLAQTIAGVFVGFLITYIVFGQFSQAAGLLNH